MDRDRLQVLGINQKLTSLLVHENQKENQLINLNE